MRILWLTYGLPYPLDCGGRIRDFNLIREVAKTAEVDLFSLAPPGGPTDPGPLPAICRHVEIIPMPHRSPVQSLSWFARSLFSDISAGAVPTYFPAVAERLRAHLIERRIDLYQVEHSLLAAYGRVASSRGCPTIISLHNVGFQQYARMADTSPDAASRALYRLKSAVIKRTERLCATQYDRCIVVSAQERNLLERSAPQARTAVVDNGVDCCRLQPLPEAATAPMLLFVGMMNYPPNADAAIHFVRTTLPRIQQRVPAVQLCIVGHSPPPEVRALEHTPGVTVAGFVPDVLPYYRRATVVVTPLRAGGGTRLKILEAMALTRAVVSTSIGCEGLEVTSRKHLLIADRPEEFAASTVELLEDTARRSELAAGARRLVQDRYDWKILGRHLAAIQREVVEKAVG